MATRMVFDTDMHELEERLAKLAENGWDFVIGSLVEVRGGASASTHTVGYCVAVEIEGEYIEEVFSGGRK